MRSIEATTEDDELGFVAMPITATPEGRLALAVLHRAVLDAITPGVPAHFAKTALWWLEGRPRNGEEFNVFSFHGIAELLSDDPDGLRESILRFVRLAAGDRERVRRARFGATPRGIYYLKRGSARILRRREVAR